MALTAPGLITDSDDLADVTGLVVAGGADWRVREVEQEVEEEEVWQEVLTWTQTQTSAQVSRGCIDMTGQRSPVVGETRSYLIVHIHTNYLQQFD